MKNTSLAGPGVFKYVLGSYPQPSQSFEDEEDEITSFSPPAGWLTVWHRMFPLKY